MAKRVSPLTSAQINNLKPNPERVIELVDGAVPGLRLRVTPAGTRSWSLNMRAAGKMRRFDVGAGLGLSEARERALVVRRQVREGFDPTAERRALRARTIAAEQGLDTFGALINEYFSKGPGTALKSKSEQVRRLRSVFADHLSVPGMTVESVALQLTVDRHPSRTAAARAVAYLRPILKWAAKRNLVTAVFDLEKPHTSVDDDLGAGQRFLSDAELRAILPHLNDAYGHCCEYILLTGVRLAEACSSVWSEIDLEAATWTISPARRKDTRSRHRRRQVPSQPHVIPLSRQAVELLMMIRKTKKKVGHNDSIVPLVGNDDLVFRGERGGKLQNWDRWLKQLSVKTAVSDWSAHALRRTTATLAANLGNPPHVISVILGHKNVGGQLTATYSKSRYQKEHAEALQQLADYVSSLLPKSSVVHRGAELSVASDRRVHEKSGTVVPIRSRT